MIRRIGLSVFSMLSSELRKKEVGSLAHDFNGLPVKVLLPLDFNKRFSP